MCVGAIVVVLCVCGDDGGCIVWVCVWVWGGGVMVVCVCVWGGGGGGVKSGGCSNTG